MDRFIRLQKTLLLDEREVVAEIGQHEIAALVLELILLQEGMVDSVELTSAGGPSVSFRLTSSEEIHRGTVLECANSCVRIALAKNQLEYLTATLLRAYRDQAAETGHIHLEVDQQGGCFDATFLFETVKGPLTATEATRRLSADD